MPNPAELNVGDRVRFVSLPEEWKQPGYVLHRESRAFIRAMIRRRFPSRVYEIDEYGTPWIAARIWQRGRYHHHIWGILESTGWRRVERKG